MQRTGLGRFASFVAVGGLGFVVDAAILSTLVYVWDWPHYSARVISFAAAVSVTWYCNREWVFTRTKDRAREYGAYFGVQAVGAVINLGTYAVLIALVPSLARLPLVPLAAGAALALLFNYSGATRWVFADPARKDRSR
ncbi:MAG TPA: GtrA family protein [Gammaproteobacteria bacterium]|nr:GtrA family protein [Gammaproteobacteria bacterium]